MLYMKSIRGWTAAACQAPDYFSQHSVWILPLCQMANGVPPEGQAVSGSVSQGQPGWWWWYYRYMKEKKKKENSEKW